MPVTPGMGTPHPRDLRGPCTVPSPSRSVRGFRGSRDPPTRVRTSLCLCVHVCVCLSVCLPACLCVCFQASALEFSLAAPPAGSYCFTRRPGLWARGRAPAPHVATAESGLAATARAPVPSPTSSPPRPTRGPRNAVGVGQRSSPAPQSRAGWAGRGAGGRPKLALPSVPSRVREDQAGTPGDLRPLPSLAASAQR